MCNVHIVGIESEKEKEMESKNIHKGRKRRYLEIENKVILTIMKTYVQCKCNI